MNVNQLYFVSAVLLLNRVLAINELVVTLLANCSWPLAQDNSSLPHYPVPSSFASPPTQAWTSQHLEFKTQPREQLFFFVFENRVRDSSQKVLRRPAQYTTSDPHPKVTGQDVGRRADIPPLKYACVKYK